MFLRVAVLIVCSISLSPLCRAQNFSSQAVANAVACSPNDGEFDGGSLEVFATASAAANGDCGATGLASASSSAYADLATGIVAATAQGNGPPGSHRATGSSDFSDRLVIVAPPDVDAVAIAITVTFTVEADDSFPASENRLLASVSVPPNEVDLFLCNPLLCPNDPLVPLFLSEVFVAQRGLLNGEFSDVYVTALARADMADGAATLAAAVTVTVADDSGALLVSDSGVFGSGPADADGDGIPDALDNCSAVSNPDQRDTNLDGFGNMCDPDLNNDLIVNAADLGLLRSVFFSGDADADFNGDGVVNALDLGILRSLFSSRPAPVPSCPDACATRGPSSPHGNLLVFPARRSCRRPAFGLPARRRVRIDQAVGAVVGIHRASLRLPGRASVRADAAGLVKLQARGHQSLDDLVGFDVVRHVEARENGYPS